MNLTCFEPQFDARGVVRSFLPLVSSLSSLTETILGWFCPSIVPLLVLLRIKVWHWHWKESLSETDHLDTVTGLSIWNRLLVKYDKWWWAKYRTCSLKCQSNKVKQSRSRLYLCIYSTPRWTSLRVILQPNGSDWDRPSWSSLCLSLWIVFSITGLEPVWSN